ncbi:hypothetical protein Tco_0246819 [Tanacetum coccineum]
MSTHTQCCDMGSGNVSAYSCVIWDRMSTPTQCCDMGSDEYFEISSWRGARVDVRTYLLGGAIDGSEANGIIRNPKSSKVRVGSNGNLLWEASVLLGRKKGRVHGDDVANTVFRMRNGHVEVYSYAFWVNQCTSGFHGVNEPVFQQRGSGAKRKLSRCRRNQMGNEPILALPEGADDFIVYYDARSKDLEACLEKREKVTVLWAVTGESELNGSNLYKKFDNQDSGLYWKGLRHPIVIRLGCFFSFGLPEELSRVHETFHVLNLKKCLADASLRVPLDEIKVNKTLRFVEEPVEIMDREIKSLKHSRILLVKVRWNSKRGPEFTWEHKDYMKSKYPKLFVERTDESAS